MIATKNIPHGGELEAAKRTKLPCRTTNTSLHKIHIDLIEPCNGTEE